VLAEELPELVLECLLLMVSFLIRDALDTRFVSLIQSATSPVRPDRARIWTWS